MSNNSQNWYNDYVKNHNIDPLNIPLKENQKIAVIGDIHEQNLLFELLLTLIEIDNSNLGLIDRVVSLGDLYDKGFGEKNAESILQCCLDNEFDVIKGNHEIKKIKYYRRNQSVLAITLARLPNVLSFVWPNQFRLTCLHAGVTPRHAWDDLKYNSEICYVRTVNKNGEMIPLIWVEKNGKRTLEPKEPDGNLWHEIYDGRFGYIVSGHDQQDDGIPKFYKNSCNIDTAAYKTGILTASIFGQNGFEKIIQTSK